MISQLLKIGLLSAGAFLLAMFLTPLYTHFAYKHQWWKKMRTKTVDGEKARIYQKLHKGKHKRNIPTMAGVLIWGTVLILTLI
ncbi:MAG: hypothetical protein ACD_24C00287G0003, partial [uncultured bacterium]